MTDRTRNERQQRYRQRLKEAKDAALVAGAPTAPQIATMPGIARWTALHEQARRAIETMRDEMQSYYDDRSEQWQEGDRGEAFGELIERTSELLSSVEEFTPKPET